MKWHEIKVDPVYFQEVLDSKKTFMIRNMDRGYEVGDLVRKWEYDRETKTYSGRYAEVKITSLIVAEDFPTGLLPEMGAMSIALFGYGKRTPEEAEQSCSII